MSAAAGTLPKDLHQLRRLVGKEETNNTEKRPLGASLKKEIRGGGDRAANANLLRSDRKELDIAGAKFSLKEQMDKDKGDETQKGWKQMILGSIIMNNGSASAFTDRKESELRILSLAIQCPGSGRPDLVLPIPLLVSNGISKRTLFVLKEGCRCRTKFSFTVLNSTVSGLRYTYTVWKAGVRVGNTKTLIGTFNPREEPYSYELAEDTIPTGIFARGSYFVKTKFVDNEGNCYLEFSYYFEIRKNWP